MNVEHNIRKYLSACSDGRGVVPTGREASFHYCFNYFQAFHETRHLNALGSPQHLETTCLHLGFFLASWGMFRGKGFLPRKSAKFYEPLVQIISTTDPVLWEIDAHCYTPPHIRMLLELKARIVDALGTGNQPSDTLVTKLMLGVFGCVPAFDTYFKSGLKVSRFDEKALEKVAAFYEQYRSIVDRYRVETLDFKSGQPTQRKYSRAKVIDMAFFIEGGGK